MTMVLIYALLNILQAVTMILPLGFLGVIRCIGIFKMVEKVDTHTFCECLLLFYRFTAFMTASFLI